MVRYTAFSLDRSRIGQAYPVIQAATGLSLDQWQRFALSVLDSDHAGRPDRGVRCLARPDGYISGLYSYLVAEHVTCGRVLLCNHVVALDMIGVYDVESAVYADMDDVARGLECQAVHVRIPAGLRTAMPAPGDGRGPVDRGFALEAVELCRKVTATR